MTPGKQEFFTPHHVSMIAAVIAITVVTDFYLYNYCLDKTDFSKNPRNGGSTEWKTRYTYYRYYYQYYVGRVAQSV
jgi:hypothetical protein